MIFLLWYAGKTCSWNADWNGGSCVGEIWEVATAQECGRGKSANYYDLLFLLETKFCVTKNASNKMLGAIVSDELSKFKWQSEMSN